MLLGFTLGCLFPFGFEWTIRMWRCRLSFREYSLLQILHLNGFRAPPAANSLPSNSQSKFRFRKWSRLTFRLTSSMLWFMRSETRFSSKYFPTVVNGALKLEEWALLIRHWIYGSWRVTLGNVLQQTRFSFEKFLASRAAVAGIYIHDWMIPFQIGCSLTAIILKFIPCLPSWTLAWTSMAFRLVNPLSQTWHLKLLSLSDSRWTWRMWFRR